MSNRLIVVKHIPELDFWVVDTDSEHHLQQPTNDSHSHVQELEVVKITPLATKSDMPNMIIPVPPMAL